MAARCSLALLRLLGRLRLQPGDLGLVGGVRLSNRSASNGFRILFVAGLSCPQCVAQSTSVSFNSARVFIAQDANPKRAIPADLLR